MDDDLEDEAALIARRLVRRPATCAEQGRYAEAVRRLAGPLTEDERRLWDLMLRRAWLLDVVDGGLALREPGSPLRQRIYIMLAILEASPDHVEDFLPREFPRLVVARLVGRAVAAGAKSLAGAVVLGWLRRSPW